VIHVYAFARDLTSLPEVPGLDGMPLEALEVDGVQAIFSRPRREPSAATLRADAVAHGAVVDALVNLASVVVPVRFGERVSDPGSLGDSLRRRVPALRRTFARVHDCVELGIRVWGDEEPVVSSPDGTTYMRRRAAIEARRLTAVDHLHRRLATLARESRVEAGRRPGGEAFAAAYLVPRSSVDDVRTTVDAFGASHGNLTVVCTGPWAPFSFVDEENVV
jgi:hypothetical protein